MPHGSLVSPLDLRQRITGCDEDSAGSGAMDASGRTADMPSETDAQSMNAQDAVQSPSTDATSCMINTFSCSIHLDMASIMTDATPPSDLGSPLVDMGIEVSTQDSALPSVGDAAPPRPIDEVAPPCGGPEGLTCLNGYDCVDDPRDGCRPELGAQGCAGFCMPSYPDVCRMPRRCNSRIVEFCQDGEFVEEAVCARNERCVDAACRALPRSYGVVCSLASQRRFCLRAGLYCGGTAVVPYCLHPETADGLRGAGEECYGHQDCLGALVCTLEGRCAAGHPGDACRDDGDCRNDCVNGECSPDE